MSGHPLNWQPRFKYIFWPMIPQKQAFLWIPCFTRRFTAKVVRKLHFQGAPRWHELLALHRRTASQSLSLSLPIIHHKIFCKKTVTGHSILYLNSLSPIKPPWPILKMLEKFERDSRRVNARTITAICDRNLVRPPMVLQLYPWLIQAQTFQSLFHHYRLQSIQPEFLACPQLQLWMVPLTLFWKCCRKCIHLRHVAGRGDRLIAQ